jgi:hypothetical protein
VTTTDVDGLLPDPWDLLAGTDWASLEHACGSAAGTPALLAGLLADDAGTQAKALRHLNGPVHHQNTIYSTTVPAAVYVVRDPRAATEQSLRAVLSVAALPPPRARPALDAP